MASYKCTNCGKIYPFKPPYCTNMLSSPHLQRSMSLCNSTDFQEVLPSGIEQRQGSPLRGERPSTPLDWGEAVIKLDGDILSPRGRRSLQGSDLSQSPRGFTQSDFRSRTPNLPGVPFPTLEPEKILLAFEAIKNQFTWVSAYGGSNTGFDDVNIYLLKKLSDPISAGREYYSRVLSRELETNCELFIVILLCIYEIQNNCVIFSEELILSHFFSSLTAFSKEINGITDKLDLKDPNKFNESRINALHPKADFYLQLLFQDDDFSFSNDPVSKRAVQHRIEAMRSIEILPGTIISLFYKSHIFLYIGNGMCIELSGDNEGRPAIKNYYEILDKNLIPQRIVTAFFMYSGTIVRRYEMDIDKYGQPCSRCAYTIGTFSMYTCPICEIKENILSAAGAASFEEIYLTRGDEVLRVASAPYISAILNYLFCYTHLIEIVH